MGKVWRDSCQPGGRAVPFPHTHASVSIALNFSHSFIRGRGGRENSAASALAMAWKTFLLGLQGSVLGFALFFCSGKWETQTCMCVSKKRERTPVIP